MIVLAVVFVVRLIIHFPYIAVVMGIFVCVVMMLLAAKYLIDRFAPRCTAEKRLERCIREGAEACIAYFVNSGDGPPDFTFSTTIQRHNGLKTLEFSIMGPETVIEGAIENCGKEMEVFFYRNGRQYIGFTGTLEILHDTEPYVFQIVIHTAYLSDRVRFFRL